MKQAAHFLTVAADDLDAVRDFYTDGLGWAPLLDVPGEVLFFQVAPGLVLGFFDTLAFEDDLGRAAEEDRPVRPSGFTLSHNVGSPAEVDAVLHTASSAGATILKPGQQAAFGGYHGYFQDPVGTVWEVAHNPAWHVEADGTVRLEAVKEG